MNDRLARIEVIVSDWASDDSDAIDDLDALCQIAEVLGIDVEPRTPASVEAKLCSICIAAGRVYCPPEHRQAYDITGEELTTTAPPEQQSPRAPNWCDFPDEDIDALSHIEEVMQQSPRVCVSDDGDKSESD